MNDIEKAQAAESSPRPKRTTLEGRKFGGVSYPAEFQQSNDLRRSVPVRWDSSADEEADNAPRTTGERRRTA